MQRQKDRKPGQRERAQRLAISSSAIGGLRMQAQRIVHSRITTPAEVVAWLGAVQAQDYGAAKWAVGLRLGAAVDERGVEAAVLDGSVLRTHALRGTWHFIAARDIRWMLALVGPTVIAHNARRYRELELEPATFVRSHAALVKALGDGVCLTRTELGRRLCDAGVSTGGQRLAFLLQRAELDAILCSGAPRRSEATYTLLDRRVPAMRARFDRDAALSELAWRYFSSRGPATVDDFAWWAGLGKSDAQAGLESIRNTLVADTVEGRVHWRRDAAPAIDRPNTVHLLPAFDEYLIGYRNRESVLDPRDAKLVNAGGGLLAPCVVVDGRLVGTWRRSRTPTKVTLEVTGFRTLRRSVLPALTVAARRYAAFLGVTAQVRLVPARSGSIQP